MLKIGWLKKKHAMDQTNQIKNKIKTSEDNKVCKTITRLTGISFWNYGTSTIQSQMETRN